MLDHTSVPRCVVSPLLRTDGLWITVCLTCPMTHGYNARGHRSFATVKEAHVSGRDHARAKLRHRIRTVAQRAEHVAWLRRVLDSRTWEEFVNAGREKYPHNWAITTSMDTDAHMAYTKTQLTYALEMLTRRGLS